MRSHVCPHAHAYAPGVVKPDTYKPVPDEPPNPTNVEETLQQIQANDGALEDVNLNNIKVRDLVAVSPRCPQGANPSPAVPIPIPMGLVPIPGCVQGTPRCWGASRWGWSLSQSVPRTSPGAARCPGVSLSWGWLPVLGYPWGVCPQPGVALGHPRVLVLIWQHPCPFGDSPHPLGAIYIPWVTSSTLLGMPLYLWRHLHPLDATYIPLVTSCILRDVPIPLVTPTSPCHRTFPSPR